MVGELLTTTEDIVNGSCKIVECVPNPVNVPTKDGDPDVGQCVTQAEIPKLVKKAVMARLKGWMRSVLDTSSVWTLWAVLGGLFFLTLHGHKDWQ